MPPSKSKTFLNVNLAGVEVTTLTEWSKFWKLIDTIEDVFKFGKNFPFLKLKSILLSKYLYSNNLDSIIVSALASSLINITSLKILSVPSSKKIKLLLFGILFILLGSNAPK